MKKPIAWLRWNWHSGCWCCCLNFTWNLIWLWNSQLGLWVLILEHFQFDTTEQFVIILLYLQSVIKKLIFSHLDLIPWTSGEQQYNILVDNWSPVLSGYKREECIWIYGMTGGWGELNREQVAEASCFNWPGGSLYPCIFGTGYLRIRYCKDPKGYW